MVVGAGAGGPTGPSPPAPVASAAILPGGDDDDDAVAGAVAIGPLIWVAPLGLLLDFQVFCHPDPNDPDYDVALNAAIDRLRELGRQRAALGRTGLGLDRQDDDEDDDDDDDDQEYVEEDARRNRWTETRQAAKHGCRTTWREPQLWGEQSIDAEVDE
ncbi:uncharacterized protein GLRG_03416 [Colletotrichum graminicola M1.001]|uniref:Uncharacterized protein n=1 Tax=Colletotrichum graminicola (strain M1.001 / M2 / FGSC 10212) TaxID=645133 RepID=E3QC37_COLGM|nr:uncharacterized protein GLRG_03416 [Colletotrichum graminicola M1.001]EFQ28272.1 hypothetical protein GLRG_03416 [Colletotrichum graminicola M1.001]